MPNYYERVEGNLHPGHFALVSDINEIQGNTEQAIAQLIMDNLGDAYILSPDEDAFTLTRVEANQYIDKKIELPVNQEDRVSLSLDGVIVRQPINKDFSSFYNIIIYARNTNSEAADIPVAILDAEGEIITQKTTTIPPQYHSNGNHTSYTVNIPVDHLPRGLYYFQIGPATIPGVDILVGQNVGSEFNEVLVDNGAGEFQGIGKRLIFIDEYADKDSRVYLVKGGEAIIRGEKIYNVDTHVRLEAPPTIGSRIDLIVMDSRGYLSIIQGTPGTTPEAPSKPYGVLKIAKLIYSENNPDPVIVSDDHIENIRLRSLLERVRRLEKRMKWVIDYDIPKRVKWDINLTSSVLSSQDSLNVGDTGAGIGVSNTETILVTQGGSGGLTIDSSITTADVKDEYVALKTAYATDYAKGTPNLPASPSRRWIEHRTYVYSNPKKISTYHGAYFIPEYDLQLTKIRIFMDVWSNIKSVKLMLFTLPEGKEGSANSKYVASSSSVDAKQIKKESQIIFTFNDVPIKKGMRYFFLIVPTPSSKSKPGMLKLYTLYDADYEGHVKSAYAIYNAYHPPREPTKNYAHVRYSMTINKRYPESPWFVLYGKRAGYNSSGMIQSNAYATNSDIKSVQVFYNIETPDGTSYKIEVSNDNGQTWVQVGRDGLASFSGTGKNFKYRVTLYTTNPDRTPIIREIEAGILFKFKLTLQESGTPPTSGVAVTLPIEPGSQTLNPLGPLDPTLFNKYEWIRVWGSEAGGSIRVTLQYYSNGTWKTSTKLNNKRLSEFAKLSVDYDDYEAELDDDENNWYIEVDEAAIYPKIRLKFDIERAQGSQQTPTIRKIGTVTMLR